MSPRPAGDDNAAQLRVERDGTLLVAKVRDVDDLIVQVERLAPHVPSDATWSVKP